MKNEIQVMNKKKHHRVSHVSYLTSRSSPSARGFSLIEMMVSVTIFAVVMMIGVGALLSLIETNRRAQAINSTVNNLNAALEGMSRSIRTGISYYCSANANQNLNGVSGPRDCTNGGGKFIAFKTSSVSSSYTAYRLSGGQLQRNSGSGWVGLTSSEIDIDTFNVSVRGAGTSGDTIQPRVLMIIKGSAPVPGGRTEFQIQSSVVQRILDI